jgi:hypothetical protein
VNEVLHVTVGHASLYVAGVAVITGAAVLVAVRGLLTTAIEGARLNADNDERSARWLWLNGYRKTPHAGPDLTEPEPKMLALSDRPAADDDERDGHIGYLLALAVAYVVLAPVAFVRGQAGALWSYVRERLQSDDARAAEWSQPAEVEYAGRRRCDEQSVNDTYRGRRVHPDFVTGVHPIVIPAQREGGADL